MIEAESTVPRPIIQSTSPRIAVESIQPSGSAIVASTSTNIDARAAVAMIDTVPVNDHVLLACPAVLANDPNYLANSAEACAGSGMSFNANVRVAVGVDRPAISDSTSDRPILLQQGYGTVPRIDTNRYTVGNLRIPQ